MQDATYPKINIVVGTRAQLIKSAPVMKLLQDKEIDYRFIYTAQHKTTIDEIRENFGLKSPDHTVIDWDNEAKTMKLFIGSWFFRVVWKLFTTPRQIIPTKGGIVLTHGDTVTTVWGAILGKLTGNKVMHLESGLRSFSILKPFPEEINRLITFLFTDIYACPNEWAMNNLKRYRGIKINTKLNTQYDSLRIALQNKDKVKVTIPKKKYAVVSIHRYEHIFKEEKFKKIIRILEEIAKNLFLVFVMHPATVGQLTKFNLRNKLDKNPNISLMNRLPFFEFIKLTDKAEFVITDGGSNQEELSYMGKPTLILRDVTERVEGLGENAVLAEFDQEKIQEFVKGYKKYKRPFKKVAVTPSEVIVNWLEENGYAG